LTCRRYRPGSRTPGFGATGTSGAPRPLECLFWLRAGFLRRRIRPGEGTSLGPLPEALTARRAARKYLVHGYAVATGGADKLTFRQGTSGPETRRTRRRLR